MSAVFDIRAPMRLGLAASLFLLAGVLGWSTQTRIASAVSAPGEVDLAPLRHPVQHLLGGVVQSVRVREGQFVGQGDLLLQLDGTSLQRERLLVAGQLAQARAISERLNAESSGRAPIFPSPQSATQAGQTALYQARRRTLDGQLEQLAHQEAQLTIELAAVEAQITANADEITLVEADLDQNRALVERGLSPNGRLATLAREAARLRGAQAGLELRYAEMAGQLSGLALQADALQATQLEQVETQAIEVGRRQSDLEIRLAELDDQLAHLDLRAPVSGLVHGLAIATAGAVLRPGEVAMQIVPRGTRPVLAVRVSPDDVDHLYIGQDARLHFTALERLGVRGLEGQVTAISAATFSDERTGAHHFRVEVALKEESEALLGETRLLPGMRVQAFMATGESAPIAYLLDPILRHLRRALREP